MVVFLFFLKKKNNQSGHKNLRLVLSLKNNYAAYIQRTMYMCVLHCTFLINLKSFFGASQCIYSFFLNENNNKEVYYYKRVGVHRGNTVVFGWVGTIITYRVYTVLNYSSLCCILWMKLHAHERFMLRKQSTWSIQGSSSAEVCRTL